MPRFCSAACSIMPASLNAATGLTRTRNPASANQRSQRRHVAEQRLVGQCVRRRARAGAARRRASRRRSAASRSGARHSSPATCRRLGAARRDSPRAADRPVAARRAISIATSGCRSRHRPMRGSSQRCANDGSSVTRRSCPAPEAATPAARTPSSSCASAGSTRAATRRRRLFSTMRRPRRSNSSKPSCSSSTLDLLADGAVRQVQLLGRGAQVCAAARPRGTRAGCAAGGETCW